MRYPILVLALAVAGHAGVMAWNGVEDRTLETCKFMFPAGGPKIFLNPKYDCTTAMKRHLQKKKL